MTEPLFTSAHAALVFAFNFSGQAYDRPLMNRMAAPTVGTGKGLAGLDGAAQAGMVRAEVRVLGRDAEAILIARFAPRSLPCSCRAPCCSGHRPNPEWAAAIGLIADRMRTTALVGCTSDGVMRRAYVVRYFSRKTERVALQRLAEDGDRNLKTVEAHYGKIAKHLRTLEGAAEAAIDDRLKAAQMVGY